MADQPMPPLPYVPGLDDDPSYQRWREETKRALGIKTEGEPNPTPGGLPAEAWAELLPPAQAQAIREAQDRRRGIVMGEAIPTDRAHTPFDRVQAAEEELRMRHAKPARVVIEENSYA